MGRRAQLAMWAAIVTVSVVCGLAIAGVPGLGGADERTDAVGGGATTTTTTSVPSTTTTSSTTTTTPTSTTAVPPARPPAEVKVVVANGTDTAGVAGDWTGRIEAAGYPTGTPTDADGDNPVTTVWFVAGFDAEAAAVAAVVGSDPNLVVPMPDPPPFELDGANVAVRIGDDLAG